jgi:phage-related minor tail protein
LFVLNHRAFSQTSKVKTTVVDAATLVTDTVHNVAATLRRVEDKIESYHIPGWEALNSTEAKLNEQAGLVTAKINRNVRKFNRLLNDVYVCQSHGFSVLFRHHVFTVLATIARPLKS